MCEGVDSAGGGTAGRAVKRVAGRDRHCGGRDGDPLLPAPSILCFLLLHLLRVLGAGYDSFVGALPTVCRHISCLRSMRAERPEYDGVAPTVTMAERIAIVTVVLR